MEEKGFSRRTAAVRTVLVVDDEEPVRRLLRAILARNGYRVVEASDGLSALAAFDDAIDLLITDVVMPGMGGMELARWIRFLRPETSLLFISGHAEDDLESRCRSMSHGRFLQKPFTAKRLLDQIQDILGSS